MRHPHVSQIALSVADMARSESFYAEVFGLLPAGGTRIRGRIASRVMGLEGVDADCHWLVGRDEMVQLELFAFRSPEPVARAADARVSDIGYARMGLWVGDFDAVLARLAARGVRPLREALGEVGERRACVRDPDGIFLELFEHDPHPQVQVPRPDCPVALRSVTLSVPDVERSRAFFGDALGMQQLQPLKSPAGEGPGSLQPSHMPDHEGLGSMQQARSPHTPDDERPGGQQEVARESVVLDGGPVLVELASYHDARPRAAGYRISDVGILNIALGFDDRKTARRTYRAVIEAGYQSCRKPLDAGWYSVVYCFDEQGFSVELLYIHRWFTRFSGYAPR